VAETAINTFDVYAMMAAGQFKGSCENTVAGVRKSINHAPYGKRRPGRRRGKGNGDLGEVQCKTMSTLEMVGLVGKT
jgi:hypothetical protein